MGSPVGGISLKSIADSTAIVLLSRVMQLIGIPAGMFFASWMFTSMNAMIISVERLNVQMEERTKDRYTETDARHDFTVVGLKLNALDSRIGVLESKIDGKK